MKFRNVILSMSLAIASTSLTACSVWDFGFSNNYNQNSDILEGNWHDNGGMISTFSKGHFTTVTPDTNEKLSEGSYNIDPENPRHVTMILKSLVRGTKGQVDCTLSSYNHHLSCTSTMPNRITLEKPKEDGNSETNLTDIDLKAFEQPETTSINFDLWRNKN